jgi:hypothetical protein
MVQDLSKSGLLKDGKPRFDAMIYSVLFERTSAMRQGFKPLPDCGCSVNENATIRSIAN